MWELRSTHPFGSLSKRSILTFVASILVTCFVYIFATAPTTHAADAEWLNDAIVYQNQTYTKVNAVAPNTLPGIAQYVYIEPALSNASLLTPKAHVIYFANSSDPPKETSAQYITYNFTAPSTYASDGSTAKTISLSPQAEAPPSGDTSCEITGGTGWVICPITNFLADGMDSLYKVLSAFLVVQPVNVGSDNSGENINFLYRAWSYMRNFANVAFVIGFLIIIYSQVSSIGLSSYGIKKLLPRLIIAAILVNVSYWICAIAIDLSNIAGYSIQDLLVGIRNSLVGAEGNGFDVFNWKSMAALALGGATAAGTAGILLHTGAAATGGVIYMLLPILVGVLLAILVALLVLAARQAIITVLVIIAPLAMVAYLLPNTEKYFEKWRSLFTTMLVMFPIFSVIFGGSQLAGMAIIQSAKGAGSLTLVVLGMAVQVAPVVITPLLVRLSGSLLGKIAGMVNNPNKGLIDRTRKWSQERADQHKARVLANPDNRYKGRWARAARKIDTNRRERAGWQKTHEAMADNSWHGSDAYGKIDTANRDVENTKKIIENHHETTWNNKVRLDPSLLQKELKVQLTGDQADFAKKQLETIYQEAKTAKVDPKTGNLITPSTFNDMVTATGNAAFTSSDMIRKINQSRDVALDLTKESLRKQNADRALNSMVHDEVKRSDAADRQRIGGVMGEQGANSAVAYAISEERKAFGAASAESSQLFRHFNPDAESLQKFIEGQELTLTDDAGVSRTFKANDIYARDAAIEMQMTEGPIKYAIEVAALSGSTLRDYRTTIASAGVKAGLGGKTSFMGGTTWDQIKAGDITSREKFLEGVVQDNIAKGKISPDVLTQIDVDAVEAYVNAALEAQKGNTGHMDPYLQKDIDRQIQAFSAHAYTALNHDLYKGKVKDNVRGKLETLLNATGYTPPPTPPPTAAGTTPPPAPTTGP